MYKYQVEITETVGENDNEAKCTVVLEYKKTGAKGAGWYLSVVGDHFESHYDWSEFCDMPVYTLVFGMQKWLYALDLKFPRTEKQRAVFFPGYVGNREVQGL